MALLVYLKNEYENQHEMDQYFTLCEKLKDYYGTREELCVFIGNYSIGGSSLDGFIIKQTGFAVVEFKSHGGKIVAVENGHWTSNGLAIRGGAPGKNVLDQIKTNRSNVRTHLRNMNILPEENRMDLGGIVVFNESIELDNRIDSQNINIWLRICDNDLFVKNVRSIKGREISFDANQVLEIVSRLGLSDNDLDKEYCFIPDDKIDSETNIGTTQQRDIDQEEETEREDENSQEENNSQIEIKLDSASLSDIQSVLQSAVKTAVAEVMRNISVPEVDNKKEESFQEKKSINDELSDLEEEIIEEEEDPLDNLFDMPEDDSLSESTQELEQSTNEDEPDIKDRMVQKALNFIKQGLTPSQIIKEKRWRPINTYTRLTKLVELGYYDAKKFIDDKTYDVIMESIKVLGSKADVNNLQDNCSKRVSLWQVKMILAELKFNKKVIPAQKKKVNDWFFIKGLVFSKNKTSKWFFEKKYNHKCRVVRSAAGYYLQLGEEFIKLGNYDSAIRYYDEGSIWVKSDYGNKLGHPLVHAIGKISYLIGHIRDTKQKIIFTTPEGEEKTITFS